MTTMTTAPESMAMYSFVNGRSAQKSSAPIIEAVA